MDPPFNIPAFQPMARFTVVSKAPSPPPAGYQISGSFK
jgi:hypothetical protein